MGYRYNTTSRGATPKLELAPPPIWLAPNESVTGKSKARVNSKQRVRAKKNLGPVSPSLFTSQMQQPQQQQQQQYQQHHHQLLLSKGKRVAMVDRTNVVNQEVRIEPQYGGAKNVGKNKILYHPNETPLESIHQTFQYLSVDSDQPQSHPQHQPRPYSFPARQTSYEGQGQVYEPPFGYYSRDLRRN